MPIIRDSAIAGAAATAGFRGDALVIAVAVALAESTGNTTAINPTSGTRGLWQIHPKYHPELLRQHNWADATGNARMAYAISSGGSNWQPWEAYTNGAYRKFIPRARRAAGNPADALATGGLPALDTGPTASGVIVSGLKRGALIWFGVALIVLAIIIFATQGPIAKIIPNPVKMVSKGIRIR